MTARHSPHHPARRRTAASLFIIAAALALGLARGEGHGPRPARAAQADDLRVLRRSPDDGDSEIGTDAVLLVQFNTSVQPLTTLAETPDRPALRIDPPVAGEGRWLTSAMYRFRPAEGWQPSSRYTVSVRPDLRGLDGRAPAAPISWSFTTISPAVVEVSPGANTNQAPIAPGLPVPAGSPRSGATVPPSPIGRIDSAPVAQATPAPPVFVPPTPPPPPRGTPRSLPPTVTAVPSGGAVATVPPGGRSPGQPAPPGVQITVRFNQAVDQAAAQRALSCAPAIPGTFTWPDARTMVLRPAAPLPRGTTYECTVAAGVPSANGLLSSSKPFTWSFATVGRPGVIDTQPRQGDTNAGSGFIILAFNTPMDRRSVEDRLTLAPAPAEGELRTFWDPSDTRISLSYPGRPSTDYRLTLAPGAVDRFDGVIEDGLVLAFRTAPLPPSIGLTGDAARQVVPAGVSPRITLSSVNVAGTEVTLYRIDEPTFVSLTTRGGEQVPPPGATELSRRPVTFRNELDQRETTPVDLSDAPLPPGFYLLWIAPPPGNSFPLRLPFLVTRSHLTMKRTYDQVLVWALDYSTGEPLSGLPLRLLDFRGDKLGDGRTDAQGLATIALPAPGQSNPLLAIGDRDGDVVFASLNWNDIGGFPYPPSIAGVVATERPLYRPGETVYFQGVLRRDDDARLSIPASAQFTAVATDSRGRELMRGPLTVDEFGAVNGELALDPTAATGRYGLRIEAGANTSVAFASFTVAAFRRPEYNVTVKTDGSDYDDGDRIGTTATARLFLGAPLIDAPVRWRVSPRPFVFSSADFPGYSFADPDEQQRPAAPPAQEGEPPRTGRDGSAGFVVPADVSGFSTSQVFEIEATVLDLDNQAVSARTQVRVHKTSRYAGVRPRGYVATAGRPVTVDLAAVERSGRPAPDEPLSVRIVERRYTLVRTRGPDGAERAEYRPEDTEVETRTVRTGPDGTAELTFTPARGGQYRIAVSGRDPAGREHRAAASIYVSSTEFVPWRFGDDTRIELQADKTEYQPGDVARVLVPAPFTGAVGLVTVERQGILAREVRPFPENSAVLEIPIEAAHIPNIFVSVVLFKPGEAGAGPQYRSGLIELPVSPEGQRLKVEVIPDRETAGPRGEVTFTVRTTDAQGRGVPAELSMALVDEAVLSLSTDRPPDPFTTFYRRRPNGVQTSAASRAAFRPSGPTPAATPARTATPAAARPGGGPDTSVEGEVRTDFRFTADWRPAVRTDANGLGRVTVRMPDTLTTWRMTARGITVDTRPGTAESKVVTSKPLVVRPIAPRFFTAGDRPALGAILDNFTDAPLEVTVRLTSEDIVLDGDTVRTLRVEPGAGRSVYWPVTVPSIDVPPDATRPVTLRWSASAAGLADAVELTLPIQPFATPEVVASSGAVKDQATEVIRGPGTPGVQAADITLNLWPSLTAALPDSVRYLNDYYRYHWRNAEVAASLLLTTIGVAQAQGQPPDLDAVRGWVEYILTLQNGDGGWSWFPAYQSEPAITAHVLIALALARDADVAIDPNVFTRAAAYLRGQLDRTRDVRFPLNPNTRALLIYGLVTADGGEAGRAFDLAEQRDTLGPEGKALLLLAMQRAGVDPSDARARPLLSDLVSSATISAAAAHWDDDVGLPARLTTATRTTAFALWALALGDIEHPLVDDAVRWLMNERREGKWASTQESALSVMALGAVARARREADAAYRYTVTLNGDVVRQAAVARAVSTPQDSLVIRQGLRQGDNPLVIGRDPADAAGRLYYQLNYRYVTPAEGIGALDRGVAVAHELLSVDGDDRPLTSVKAGDLVKVRITVLVSGEMNYVAVEDFLPAGLEAADAGLPTTSRQVSEIVRAEQERQARLRRTNCRYSFFGFVSCSSPFQYVDLRDDRVSLFARTLPKGAYEYVYIARATTPGTYGVRPARAAEVYFPDVWGRTDAGTFVVEP